MFTFTTPNQPRSPVFGMSPMTVMQYYNPSAYIEYTNDIFVAYEQHIDCPEDLRTYMLVYYSTLDGKHAQAFCKHNPHDLTRPNAGYEYAKCHCDNEGNICLGDGTHRGELDDSKYTLEDAILKARYWCTAFSYMVEHGHFPQPN